MGKALSWITRGCATSFSYYLSFEFLDAKYEKYQYPNPFPYRSFFLVRLIAKILRTIAQTSGRTSPPPKKLVRQISKGNVNVNQYDVFYISLFQIAFQLKNNKPSYPSTCRFDQACVSIYERDETRKENLTR